MPQAAADALAGLALLGGGAAMWARRPASRSGPLMGLAGVAWFAGDIWSSLLFAHRGPLVHLLLAYPSGRVRSRAIRIVVAAAYADGLIPALARAPWPTIALMIAILGCAVWRVRAAAGVERRARVGALAGTVVIAGSLAVAAAARTAHADAGALALWVYDLGVAVTAVGLAAGLIRGRWSRAAVTGLVVDLGDRHEPQALRATLARALGDPDLQVAYRVADSGGWVDEAGRPVQLPEADDGARVVTFVHEGGAPVAALVHDPAALGDRALVASAAAAARLAMANVRMQADIAARVRDVADSRRRLVEAGDDARRRLGEELRLGPERQMALIAARLGELAAARQGEPASTLARLAAAAEDACVELRRFVQGIHPHVLTENGLAAALTQLAAQAAVPVALEVPDRRFPAAQEAGVYFLCSEALANVAKYAPDAQVRIAVAAGHGRLAVRVRDDGPGGADLAAGSGLRGLSDRIAALGGTLRVDSAPGAGTQLEAALPIPEADAR